MEEKIVIPGRSKKQIIGIALTSVAALFFIVVLYQGLGKDPSKVPSQRLGLPAYDFKVTWVQGQQHLQNPRPEGFNLQDFKGHPLILNFWASWCVSCRAEASDFEAFWQRYKNKGLLVAGIAIQDTPEAAKAFAQTFGKTYILGLDAEDGKAAIDYGVTGVPETFFITREGVVIHKEAGPVSSELLAQYAEQLLK